MVDVNKKLLLLHLKETLNIYHSCQIAPEDSQLKQEYMQQLDTFWQVFGLSQAQSELLLFVYKKGYDLGYDEGKLWVQ